MEEADELVPDPDSKGYLSLTNRAWVNLDPSIWKMAKQIVTLDLSYNSIFELPPQIGEMQILRELRCSINKISIVPKEIGRISRLRRLYLNGNRLRSIPEEVGRLQLLEELVLSENSLEEIPKQVANIPALRLLRLQNNKLHTLPFELADLQSLETLDCSNNPDLAMVPKLWLGDTDSILFVCKIHRAYVIRMEEMSMTNDDLTKHSQYLEQEQLQFKENIKDFKNEIVNLKRAMPKQAMLKYEKDNRIISDGGNGGEKKSGVCVVC